MASPQKTRAKEFREKFAEFEFQILVVGNSIGLKWRRIEMAPAFTTPARRGGAKRY
jgi:hypothetical protein